MTLHSENLLKNIQQLNISNTSVCNNFIDILTSDKTAHPQTFSKKQAEFTTHPQSLLQTINKNLLSISIVPPSLITPTKQPNSTLSDAQQQHNNQTLALNLQQKTSHRINMSLERQSNRQSHQLSFQSPQNTINPTQPKKEQLKNPPGFDMILSSAESDNE